MALDDDDDDDDNDYKTRVIDAGETDTARLFYTLCNIMYCSSVAIASVVQSACIAQVY